MSLNKIEVLIIEDDQHINTYIKNILTHQNMNVLQTYDGKEGLKYASSKVPDIILLDLGLPDMDGIEVLKQIRLWTSVPIVIISARENEKEKVNALDLGADDYITKPFGTEELLARVRVSLRHAQVKTADQPFDQKEVINELTIDYEKRVVSIRDKVIHLTPIEYKILVLFIKNIGKVLTHDYIIRQVWGLYYADNQTLRVNMANLRRKIEKNPAEPEYILTEVGVGYRMIDEKTY
ncbi:Two components response regulator, receiver KpdE [Alteracholeplasma palmae J233]|uniref:Two components response regulator, receiver KpdE n=1 Tax=Alteracholeplasma palmae (strain ATCC 49389 / J233) TaxID=1318466 RepID=U4KL58_ALTPJ|nr:response regulator transcription factor [Alteracholeplasma palmae]CCV64619.1 Two components response regulator, receiver KpdE [Alteracholeplasma palmae J233]